MKEKAKNVKKSKNMLASLLIILAATALWGTACGLGFLQKFDFRFYDVMLLKRKAPEERQDLLLVDIDDFALDEIGEWPWTRTVFADALLMMKELGAQTVVFDVEFLSESQKSVNKKVLEEIEKDPIQNAEKIFQLFIDNDEYLAKSMQFFKNSWLTINIGDLNINYNPEDIEYAKKRFLYNIEDNQNLLDKMKCAKSSYKEFSPALNEIISKAQGAGFTNVEVDSDGTLRRIKLLCKYNDGVVGQLAFAPLLKILNPEKIKVFKHYIELQNCTVPSDKIPAEGETASEIKKTIKIPIANDGTMLINWLRKAYSATELVEDKDGTLREQIDKENTSFNHNSIYYPWHLMQLERFIIEELEYMNNLVPNESMTALLESYNELNGYKSFILEGLKGYDQDGNPIDGGIDSEIFEDYFALRQSFFADLSFYLNSDDFAILSHSENVFRNEESRNKSELLFADVDEYIYYYKEMQNIYNGKFCLVGNTGSGTTDLGSTPFQKSYPNVGTHANVFNTILTEDFIYPVSWYWGVILAALLSFIALCFHSDRKFAIQALWGFGLIFSVIAIPMILMLCLGFYVPIVAPSLIAICSYICISALRFRASEKDKKFITGAFSQCLSKEVVQEILKDPSKFVLGGDNYEATAIFTDIQKFSGFSELLSAKELVALLNFYLTKMSDILIEEHGTVDKYEGDAIVAFFGAPFRMEDHAIRTCSAAIKMKKAEALINQEILDAVQNEKVDSYDYYLYSAFDIMVKNKRTIFTRIGINSGNLVAGFMGAENKKNYTMMGNNVNLASRLEGVNKQYSTNGILISHTTRMMLDNRFVLRSLDRVQVVNVKTPIRLYELLGFANESNDELIQYVAVWEQTMKIFESGNYSLALAQFKKLHEIRPEDNVCKYYISLLENFFVKGKYPVPQDDIGVAYNSENPADMDPSWIGTPKEIKGTFTLLQK